MSLDFGCSSKMCVNSPNACLIASFTRELKASNDMLATRASEASPGEFVDAVLSCNGLNDAIRRWGDVETRLDNLEAIRGLARLYEQEQQRVRSPCTIVDFVAWLGDQDPDQPRSSARDAVSVLTYHGAKGLEWRFVVLIDLDAPPKADAFGLHVESDVNSENVDWADPLKGRWLRFWPWPYGAQANTQPVVRS